MCCYCGAPPIHALLVRRIYALCCGWEHVCDHNTLRHDLALQTAAGCDPASALSALIKLIAQRLRQFWPDVRLIVRGDSDFCRPAALRRFEICSAGAPVATNFMATSCACCWPRWPTRS